MSDPVKLVDTQREVAEISDIDHHLPDPLLKQQLGDDWGDGFYVQPELVRVDRGPSGEIVRTTPLSAVAPDDPLTQEAFERQEEQKAVLGRNRPKPSPLTTQQRERLVGVMADRLMNWYMNQPPKPNMYNPVYDGIPVKPRAAGADMVPLPGTNLFPASPQEVYEYLRDFIAERAEFRNSKTGRAGHRSDIVDSLRVHTKPVRRVR